MFLNFRPFVGAVFKYRSGKRKKNAPGFGLNFRNYLSINILVPKLRFPKMYFFGPHIESEGYTMYLDLKSEENKLMMTPKYVLSNVRRTFRVK